MTTVFGPRRTRGETIVGVACTAVAIAMLTAYIDVKGGWHGWSAPQIVVLAAIIFDLIFGMFVVSGGTAKRWYHREGAVASRFRAQFVLAHLAYLVAAAALFGTGWMWAVVNGVVLVAAAFTVEKAPMDLKWTVALGLTLSAALANLSWLPVPTSLAWLAPLLFVKILVCFLVPERSVSPVSSPS